MSYLDVTTQGTGTTVSSADLRPLTEIVAPGSIEPPSPEQEELKAIWVMVTRYIRQGASSRATGDATSWQDSGVYSSEDEARVGAYWSAIFTDSADETTFSADLPIVGTGEIRIQTGYSEDLFEQLAKSNPDRLIWLIRSGKLGPADLTFAAEVIGRLLPPASGLSVLYDLLKDQSPLVREGAAYGLYHQLSQNGVRHRLQSVAEKDPSPEVRAAILDVLYD